MNATQKREKDWFRLKRYPHIGFPLQPNDKGWIEKYVSDKNKISKHAFFPFIHRKTETRKFRKEICHDGSRSILRKPTFKERELYYSNHLDANIYSYYSQLISIEYEKKLHDAGINNCVTAYRRLKLNPSIPNSRNKCNVDFANEIFSYIKNSREPELVAITFDIKCFFDNINHKKLKKVWKQIVPEFSDDHYNVFRNITKFSYVEENQIFEAFKTKILVERQPALIKNKSVGKRFYLRNKRAIAFCENDEIKFIRNKGLIKANKYVYDNANKKVLKLRHKGIPQGSPISAVLANVYLFEFDKSANDLLTHLHGIYRRYSDDMVVVCKSDYMKTVIDFFTDKIKDYCLEIQDSKTQIFSFKFDKSSNRFICRQKNLKTNKLQNNTKFEYLGFQFDGKNTLLKNSSIASYYRKMKRSFARGTFYAFHNNTNTKGQLFKSRLYKRFTYLGAERRRIYKRDKTHKDRFILSHKFDWGNYLTYAQLAANIIDDNKISNQIKRHWNNFHKLIDNFKKGITEK
ncbi:reverse transcriptase domain-containing protein [Parafilimonas sp.]|uniref:reverse transcriptase domain-containing protein n=1 Tax=Parafilimonas sp. TaxID=1969739 RepID=UPI0039E6791B